VGEIIRWNIIAIDIDDNDLVSVGDHLRNVSLNAGKSGHHPPFFVRKVDKKDVFYRLVR
jgi:hypothetical protein